MVEYEKIFFGEDVKTEVLSVFNYLHTHAETSMKETKTTEFIKNRLEAIGCRTRTFSDCPGVIGEIGSGKPVVALRADMDALWQQVDGDYRANHSCGHDAHMSMVLGTMMALITRGHLPNGTVQAIFQPAEETGEGARLLASKGVTKDADYLYGVHLRPIQEIPDGTAEPAILHGACRTISGVIQGEEAHAARPHLGRNAIEAAAAIVHEIGHIHLDPMIPCTIKMTTLHAGKSSNIIPGQATFTLDARAQTNEAMERLIDHVQRVVQAVADLYSSPIELKMTPGSSSALYHPEAIQIMGDAIRQVLGDGGYKEPIRSSGGDDFHQYAKRYPDLKATMLGLGCGLSPGLHHPKMTFNHDMMFPGISILATAVLRTLDKQRD